jgi:hypothetical protein
MTGRAQTLAAATAVAVFTALATTLPTAPAAAAPGHIERVEHRDPVSAPSRGPASALVTIEVFFVPGSGMPVGALRLLEQLQDRHPARIRLIYRVLKSGSSLLVPSAALEAYTEGKFFELMDELGKQRGVLKMEDLVELARRVGVDPQRVAVASRNDHYRDVLEANQHRFERLHGGATPSALFNASPSKVALGTITAADLDREYEAAYEHALDKLDRGFTPDQLVAAFDRDAIRGTQPVVMSVVGDDDDRSPLDHPLATPPLRLDRLPSLGKPGIAAAVPIVGPTIRRAPTCCAWPSPRCGSTPRTCAWCGHRGSMSAATMPPSSPCWATRRCAPRPSARIRASSRPRPDGCGSRRCTRRSPAAAARR